MSFANFNFLNLTFLCLQKLSEKKKEKYKMRCDEMRRVYDQKLRDFYTANPGFNLLKKNFSRALDLSNTVGIRIPD